MKNSLSLILTFALTLILVPVVSFGSEKMIPLDKTESKTLYKMLTKEKVGEFYFGDKDEGPHLNVHTIVCSGTTEEASCSLVDASFFGDPNKLIEGTAGGKLLAFLRSQIESYSEKNPVTLGEPLRVNEISCSRKPQYHCSIALHPR